MDLLSEFSQLGRVVRKPVNVNPELNVNSSIVFPCLKVFLASNIWYGLRLLNYSLKLKGKQYKQNTSPKTYKTEIKILSNPGLA